MPNYWKKKMEELEQETKKKSSQSKWDKEEARRKHEELQRKTVARMRQEEEDDIAPVGVDYTSAGDDIGPVDDTWFRKGLFADGWDYGDVTKTLLGVTDGTASLKDLTVNSMKRGYYNSIYGEESFKAMNGGQNEKEFYEKILAGDDYQFTPGNGAGEAVSGAMELLGQQFRQFTNPRTLGFVGTAVGATAIAGNAGPQALVPEEILTVPGAAVAAFKAGSAVSNLEIEAGHAYNEMVEAGISEKTAKAIAWGVGGINAGLELVQADELLDAYKVTAKSGTTKTFTQKLLAELVDRGVDVAKETAQEVVQEGVTIAGAQAAYKIDNGEYVYTADEIKERLKDTAKSSALSFGLMNAPASVKNTASVVSEQHKANTLTDNEQMVVDKVYNDRVAEAEENGKVTQKEKSKIYDQVLRDLEKGYISTDAIEETLTSDLYKKYKQDSEWEASIQKEYDELYNMKNGDKSNKQIDREAQLKKYLESFKNSGSKTLKSQIEAKVFENVKGSRLEESYNERTRRGKVFEADLSKYDENQKKVIQNAVDSGVLNNTNRSHELVDMIAKISADKGVPFDFTNNEKLKESGFAVEGKQVNGYITKDGVTINVQSPKYLQSTVGHEVTHIVEGTEFYDALKQTIFDYAKTKGEYQSRYDSLVETYKGIKDADIEQELTADLIGDYLFQDADFVNHLSTADRNVFQKIYDEIKYLCKVVTAGSKEARELEKVKRAFDKAYKESGKNQTETKHSISNVGEAPKKYGNYATPASELLLEVGPVREDITPTSQANATPNSTEQKKTQLPEENSTVSNMESVAPVAISKTETTTEDSSVAEMFPDDYAPVQGELDNLLVEQDELRQALEAAVSMGDHSQVNRLTADYESVTARIREIQAQEDERISALGEADVPPEMEAPYQGESEPMENVAPFAGRDMQEVGSRSVKAYQYENPEVKPYFREAALGMLDDLGRTTKGEKWFDEERHYLSGGEEGWGGTKRRTTDDIAELLDQWHYTYAEIEEGLRDIIEDNGKKNNAVSKRIEFMLDERLRNGYTDVWGEPMPANQEYIDLLNEKQITEYSREAFDSMFANADAFAPTMEESYAPILNGDPRKATTVPVYSNAHGQQTYIPNGATYDAAPMEDIAPVQTQTALGGNGQQTLFPNESVTSENAASTRKALHARIIDNIKSWFAENGFDLDEVLKNAKNLSTFATVDNTPQRVMEKALGHKEGGILADITVNKVAQNETEGIKWLNTFTDRKTGVLSQISKKYNITPGSKESAAAQMYAEGFYVNEKNEIIKYGDGELAADFPDVVKQAQIKGLARDPRIRQIYDETLKAINESRKRNAYPEIPRLNNYFLHFRAMNDTFSKLGLPFNPNDIRAKDLPTDLNGVTADLKPGQPYFASAQHRTGKRTSFDLLGGLEQYLTSAKNQIFHIDDIQTHRALRNYIANTYGQANGLEGLDALSEEEQQERIEQVYGAHLSTFAKFLNEEANVLAGKTALIDRGLEGVIGRRGMTFLDAVNRQVGANMVGYNISSSLTNFLAPVQAFAKTNKAAFIKGLAQFTSNRVNSIKGNGDGFAEQSPVMIRRKGAERFKQTLWQKLSDPGYVLMSAVDDVSTELIARAKYNEFISKGMDAQQAHIETDKWVSRLMGDRSLGQQPQLYNSKMLGIITKFQLEVRNQLDSQFYDTIQEAKVSNEHIEDRLTRNAMTAAKVTSTFVQLAIAQHLFGKAFEAVAGYNPAFDIISAIVKTFGWDDDEESEDTALDNIEQGFFELLDDMPYASTFTGGRIPISSALPIKELIMGEDQYGNEKSRWETLSETAPYYVLPGGYGQIKKTAAGIDMFDLSEDHPIVGSYTDGGKLRFPVEDTLASRAQAAIFGQYASKNARDYFDGEHAALNEKQIQEFTDSGMSIQEYWKYREGLSGLKTLNEKADYIASLDLETWQKNVLVNNLTDRSTPINMEGYEKYSNFEEFDFATRFPEKYKILQDEGISVSDYKKHLEEQAMIYTDDISVMANNPESYAISKVVTGDVLEYRRYTDKLGKIEADKDADGKSISGSKKQKVIDYINTLDLDYGQRIILYRSLYSSREDRNRYNQDIVDYLNSRDDIAYEDMVTVLQALDFVVMEDGTVEWD